MKIQNPREVYGRTLVEMGRENPKIVVLEADLGRSTMTCYFEQAFPARFFEMGIAEANMTSFAAGLALTGKIPFTNSFAVFAAGRAYDQIRQGVCIPALNVRIIGSSAGLSDFGDGKTHQGVEDAALMRSLPNMTVLCPADSTEVEQMMDCMLDWPGPVYFRINRNDLPFVNPVTGVAVFSGAGDPDGDGVTNADDYAWVIAHGGGRADYVQAVLTPPLGPLTVTPDWAWLFGGVIASITGQGFLPGAWVTIAGQPVSPMTVSGSEIILVIPPLANTGAGDEPYLDVDLAVVNPPGGLENTSMTTFRYKRYETIEDMTTTAFRVDVSGGPVPISLNEGLEPGARIAELTLPLPDVVPSNVHVLGAWGLVQAPGKGRTAPSSRYGPPARSRALMIRESSHGPNGGKSFFSRS